MTLLGPDYMQFISQDTGEWAPEAIIRARFQELFESRIKFLFDAEDTADGEDQQIWLA